MSVAAPGAPWLAGLRADPRLETLRRDLDAGAVAAAQSAPFTSTSGSRAAMTSRGVSSP